MARNYICQVEAKNAANWAFISHELYICKLPWVLQIVKEVTPMNLDLLYSKTATSMREVGYAESTLRAHRSAIRSLRILMEESGNTDYSEETGVHFLPKLQEKYAYVSSKRMCVAIINHLNRSLRGEPFPVPLCKREKSRVSDFPDYDRYLAWCESKDLAPGTLKNYRDIVVVITEHMKLSGIHSAAEITPRAIIAFCQSLESYSRAHKHNVVFVLRNSLLYFKEIGFIEKNLADVVPTIRYDHNAKLPSVYTEEELNRIFQCFDTNTPTGKRDYAMVLLVRYTGMRSSDATSLKFSEIDWEHDRIDIVPKKTKNAHQVFPLYPDLGEAIKDYIFNGRPVSDEEYVFLTHSSPCKKMVGSTFCSIVYRALNCAGIDIDGRKTGPHAIRHSLATLLLNRGKTITDVAKVLNHSSIQVTTIYARVDTSKLSKCPLEVPEYRDTTEFDINETLGIPVVGILAHYIADYILYEHAMGKKASADEKFLRNLSRFSLSYELTSSPLPQDMVEAWGKRRDNEKASTHLARMRTLRKFAIYLSNIGEKIFIPEIESTKGKRSDFRPHILSDEEISAFFAAADTLAVEPGSQFFGRRRYFSTLFRMLLGCGLRITEALNILVSDINFDTRSIRLLVTKNDKERVVVMSGSLTEEIRRYIVDNYIDRSHAVFSLNDGKITNAERIYVWYRKILKEAGIEHRGKDYGPRLHDFRHTFAVRSLTKMLSDGMPFYSALPILRDYLGHADIKATEKYLHLVEWMLPDIVSKMNDISNQVIPEMEVLHE